MYDNVSNPRHYAGNGDISCMDALESMLDPANVTPIQAYWWGCTFKYLWRWPNKNHLEDLKKARQCIDYLIEEVSE